MNIMKKYVVLLATLVAVMNVSAQSLMPEKGDFGLEIGLKPFSQDAVFNLIDNGIKARYFVSDVDAIRFQIAYSQYKTTDMELNQKSTYGVYDILAGYERHMNMSNRIDLYVGAQTGYQKDFAYYKEGATTYINADNNGHVGLNSFMAGALTGIDVYLWKGLYCGAEMGLKWNMVKEATKKEKKGDGTLTYPSSDIKVSSFGFYIDPAIRLGWTF